MSTMIERLEAMLASGKDDAMLRFGLGSALFNEQRFDEASVHLTQCIGHDEKYSAAYKLLGKALMQIDEHDAARQVFERGLTVSRSQGDKQSEKEIQVFIRKIDKAAS